MLFIKLLFIILYISSNFYSDGNVPKVEKPLLQKLYLPASIQILSHINDNIRPNLKPLLETVFHATSTHKPGIFSPFSSLMKSYLDISDNFSETETITKANTTNLSTISTYLFGKFYNNLLILINEHQKSDIHLNEFEEVIKFLKLFDDNFRENYIRENFKENLVRAYVKFVYMYNSLSKEGKRNNLQKFQGYSYEILNELENLSKLDCKEQLKAVLKSMLNAHEVKSESLIKKVQYLINDLNDNKGYIVLSLQNISSLKFLP